MDYKQKYKQAIFRMNKWVEGSEITDPKEVAEFVFPELKESDDGKIKNELISLFKDGIKGISHRYTGEDCERWVAWLEKQGEKIDAIENFDTEFEKQVSHLVASTINKEHEYNEGFVKWAANALLNYAKHEPEKQGEQKSTWSEKDEKMLKSVISSIRISRSSCEEDDDVRDLFDNELDWLESLEDRVSPQNFAVTDEELAQAKKDAYNDALDKIEYHSDTPTFNDGWSAAIWYLKKRTTQLQSTWKPSDEQMEIIYKYSEQNNYDGSVLTSLYRDLKKLKG